MSPINQILVSSADLVINKIHGAGKELPKFKINQIVKAKVIRVTSAREAQLLLFGEKITAKTHTPLNQGEDILLKVSRPGRKPVFQLVDSKGRSNTQILLDKIKALGRAGPYGRLSAFYDASDSRNIGQKEGLSSSFLYRMTRLLHETALKSGIPDPELLNTFIRKSGLIWEHKLRSALSSNRFFLKDHSGNFKGQDIKALAMEIMTALQHSEGELPQRVRSFIENLEILQILNKHVFEETGRYFLSFPVLFEGRLKFGQMLIDLNKNTNSDIKNEDRLIRVAFLLELTNLGDLLAEFLILKKAVSGSFRVADNDIRSFVEENLPDLKSRLNTHGFDVLHIECQVGRPEILAGTSLIDRMTEEAEGLVNLVV